MSPEELVVLELILEELDRAAEDIAQGNLNALGRFGFQLWQLANRWPELGIALDAELSTPPTFHVSVRGVRLAGVTATEVATSIRKLTVQ